MRALRDLVSAARARLAARPDTEHEQGIVRLVIAALLGAYLLPEGLDVSELFIGRQQLIHGRSMHV